MPTQERSAHTPIRTIAAILLLLSPFAPAQEAKQSEFSSAPAMAARSKRAYTVGQAQTQFIATLKVILKEVMQAGQLDEANRISKIIANPDTGVNEPLVSLRGKAAQALLKSATQRATQEYIIALKAALSQSLKAGQLEEGNRISAEVKSLEAADAMQANSTPGFVNLLAMINPDKDAVGGKWTMLNGALASSGKGEEQLQLPYEPPVEYDFQISFTKTGTNCVIQNLNCNGHPFIWVMSLSGTFTFHYVKGAGIGANKTTVKRAGLKDDHRYTSLVKVRKNGVEAYLDGKLVSKWETDFSDSEPAGFWALRNRKCLGVSTGSSKTTFHSIEVREISGPGKVLK